MIVIYLMLVAPCGAYEKSDLNAAKAIWEAYGFRLCNDPEPRHSETPYLNGKDGERYGDLCQAAPRENCIMVAVRGGYGALRFFNHPVDEQNPATLLGFSDVSVIHLQRFYQKGWIGIHGPNLLGMARHEQHPEVVATLRRLIQGEASLISYPSLNLLHGSEGSVGTLIVMNLASLTSVIGMVDPNFFAGKILAIEDINEDPYKIDRMLTQAAHAGLLANLSGLILGQFHHKDTLLNNEQIWEQAIKPIYEKNRYEFPVYDWPIFGHGSPNMPLLFGAPVRLEKAIDGEHYLHYDVEAP